MINMKDKKNYFDVLNNALDAIVTVRLKDAREFKGLLQGYDVHTNIVLDNVEEYKNGELINTLKTIIIRGDNVVYISL